MWFAWAVLQQLAMMTALALIIGGVIGGGCLMGVLC